LFFIRIVLKDGEANMSSVFRNSRGVRFIGNVLLVLVLLFGVTVYIAAAGKAEETATEKTGEQLPQHGGTLVYGIESEVPWMDPHRVFGGSNKRVAMCMFEGLIERDTSEVRRPPLVPALATSWEISDDGTVYTFHLREGVKFHDGTPWNAEAAAFNFRRVIDPDFEYFEPRAEALRTTPLRYLEDVRVVDEYTIDLILAKPWGPFFHQLATFLSSGLPRFLSPESVKKWGNDEVNMHPVGTGPFRFVEYVPGVRTVLERNPDYWDDPLPYLDKLIFVVMPEVSTRVMALETGEVQMISALPPDRIDSLIKSGFKIVMPEVTNQNWYYAINLENEYMKDVRVRRALNYAVDRDAISNKLLLGTSAPLYDMVMPTSPLFDKSAPKPFSYDPDKAKQLLKEAGYAEGIKIKAQIPTSGSSMMLPVQMTEWVQRDLAAVGVDLEIETYDWVTYLQYWINGMEPDVALNCMSWASDYSEWWAADIFGSKGFGNTGNINDPQLDRWFKEYEDEIDTEKALAKAKMIFDRVTDQAYFFVIGSDLAPIAMPENVHGMVPYPGFIQYFYRVWMEQ
jgi:peptide/nickel transport system substrate-binding protein